MSTDGVNDWWNLLDPDEKADIEQWWSDQDRQPFPAAAAEKQFEALLVSPGSYVGEMTPEVTRFLRTRFNT